MTPLPYFVDIATFNIMENNYTEIKNLSLRTVSSQPDTCPWSSHPTFTLERLEGQGLHICTRNYIIDQSRTQPIVIIFII